MKRFGITANRTALMRLLAVLLALIVMTIAVLSTLLFLQYRQNVIEITSFRESGSAGRNLNETDIPVIRSLADDSAGSEIVVERFIPFAVYDADSYAYFIRSFSDSFLRRMTGGGTDDAMITVLPVTADSLTLRLPVITKETDGFRSTDKVSKTFPLRAIDSADPLYPLLSQNDLVVSEQLFGEICAIMLPEMTDIGIRTVYILPGRQLDAKSILRNIGDAGYSASFSLRETGDPDSTDGRSLKTGLLILAVLLLMSAAALRMVHRS